VFGFTFFEIFPKKIKAFLTRLLIIDIYLSLYFSFNDSGAIFTMRSKINVAITMSSRIPKNRIKSGMRSIGKRAYPMINSTPIHFLLTETSFDKK
jgi:hypothetical protein